MRVVGLRFNAHGEGQASEQGPGFACQPTSLSEPRHFQPAPLSSTLSLQNPRGKDVLGGEGALGVVPTMKP